MDNKISNLKSAVKKLDVNIVLTIYMKTKIKYITIFIVSLFLFNNLNGQFIMLYKEQQSLTNCSNSSSYCCTDYAIVNLVKYGSHEIENFFELSNCRYKSASDPNTWVWQWYEELTTVDDGSRYQLELDNGVTGDDRKFVFDLKVGNYPDTSSSVNKNYYEYYEEKPDGYLIICEAALFDPAQITSIQMTNCVSTVCNGTNQCVGSNKDVTFTLKKPVHMYSSDHSDNVDDEGNLYTETFSINAYTKLNDPDYLIQSVDIGAFKESVTIPLTSLIEDNWGKTIYFTITAHIGNNYNNSRVSSPAVSKSFFQQISPPSKVELHRSVCNPDTLYVTVPPSEASNLSQYNFQAVSGKENEAIQIQLKKVGVSGNVGKFIVKPATFNVFSLKASDDDTLQIYDARQPVGTIGKDQKCAINYSFSIPEKDKPINITYTLSSFYNNLTGITYNLPFHNASNGYIDITVDVITQFSKWQISTDNNTWTNVAASSIQSIGANTTRIIGLTASNYYFRALDTKGCPSNTINVSLTEPAELKISSVNSTLVTCHVNNGAVSAINKSNGQIQVVWQGGMSPYRIKLYDNSGNLFKYVQSINELQYSFLNVPPQTYDIMIIDTSDQYKEQIHIVMSNPELILSASITNVNCFLENDGSIKLDVVNKNAGNKGIAWSVTGERENRNTDETIAFTNLYAGNYKAKIINNGCIDSIPIITISQPSKLTLVSKASKIARYGDNTGNISTVILGGTMPFHYTYSTQSGATLFTGNTNDTAVLTNLIQGYYNIQVVDTNGCSVESEDIHVLQPISPLTFSITNKTNVACYGNATGVVNIAAMGGWDHHYNYGMNGKVLNNTGTITGLKMSESVDSVFVIDSMNVKITLPVVITQPLAPLTVYVNKAYTPLCYGDSNGALKLKIDGGTLPYRISCDSANWMAGDSLTGLMAKPLFTVFVKDQLDCSQKHTSSLTQPTKLRITQSTIQDATCGNNNGAVLTQITGGTVNTDYYYDWQRMDSLETIVNPTKNLYHIVSGQYRLIVKDEMLCKDTVVVFVSDTNGPKNLLCRIDSVKCFNDANGEIHIDNVKGGVSPYRFYFDNLLFRGDTMGLYAGEYAIRIEDKNNCKAGRMVQVIEPDVLIVNARRTNPTCFDSHDGKIKLYPRGGNGGYTFNWRYNRTADSLIGLSEGAYDVLVTDRKGCFAKNKFQLIVPNPPSPDWIKHDAVICEGNIFALDGGLFSSYCWYNNNDTFSRGQKIALFKSGVYYLKLTDAKGCVGIDSFNLNVSKHPLDAVLLVSDSAAVNEPVTAIDVTWPVPDSIQWYFDSDVVRVASNEWSQDFSYKATGTVKVTLRAWYGGCYSDSTKSVRIFEEEFDEQKKSLKSLLPLILSFSIFPNPSTGLFSAQVILSRMADINLTVFDSGHSFIYNNKNSSGSKEYLEQYDLSHFSSGIYLLVLKAETELKTLKIVIE